MDDVRRRERHGPGTRGPAAAGRDGGGTLARVWRGYEPEAVDRFVDWWSKTHEEMRREQNRLRGELEEMRAQAQRREESERLARDALVEAQRAAGELRERTERETAILREAAREEAEALVRDARAERDRLEAEIDRLASLQNELHDGYRAFLVSALDLLEQADVTDPSKPPEDEGGGDPDASP